MDRQLSALLIPGPLSSVAPLLPFSLLQHYKGMPTEPISTENRDCVYTWRPQCGDRVVVKESNGEETGVIVDVVDSVGTGEEVHG